MSLQQPKILCALSHGLYEPWLDILKSGQEATWLTSRMPNDFQVLHFHGTPVSPLTQKADSLHEKIRWSGVIRAGLLRKIDRLFAYPWLSYIPKFASSKLLVLNSHSEVIHIQSPDTYVTYRWKELALFKYFLEETSCDFLFLTTTASYVRPKELARYVKSLPASGVYAGAHPYPEANFVSGACRILSRDVVQLVLNNRKLFDPAVIEDMALGNLIQSFGIKPIYIKLNNVDSMDSLDQKSDTELLSSFHFRLKSGNLHNRNDVEIMHGLHNRLMNLGD
jgi:hypothetical protein